MISNNWETFNKNIKIVNSLYSNYEDKEGNYAVIDTKLLLCGVQRSELTEEQLKVAKFEGRVPKDMKLKTIEVTTQIPKEKKTGKEEDKYTIIEEKEKRYVVWFIADALKNLQAFDNQEEAMQKAKEHNEKILKVVDE